MKSHIKTVVCILLIIYVFGCGTLGGFETVHFSCSKKEISIAIDSLFVNYPKYKIPQKWKVFDNWTERGYDFLDSRIFYFQDSPEEMYYVTFLGDSLNQSNEKQIDIAIRAVSQGGPKWLLNDELSDHEINRIENRFESEILSKIKCKYFKSQ